MLISFLVSYVRLQSINHETRKLEVLRTLAQQFVGDCRGRNATEQWHMTAFRKARSGALSRYRFENLPRQDKTRHDNTRYDKTRYDKTRQDKTKQDKTT